MSSPEGGWLYPFSKYDWVWRMNNGADQTTVPIMVHRIPRGIPPIPPAMTGKGTTVVPNARATTLAQEISKMSV